MSTKILSERLVYPDFDSKLDELNSLNLLYTRDRQRGVYIIPSLVRPDIFDLILINMAMDESRNFIQSGRIATLSEEDHCDLKGVFL